MPLAVLLLREESNTSLSSLVEKSQQQKKSFSLEYDLQLNQCRLDLVLTSKSICKLNSTTSNTDEGFESDIDSLSIVSSDDSFTSTNISDNNSKTTTETDSANGSASSDSDTESPSSTPLTTADEQTSNANDDELNNKKESFNLVDCICYTDVKFPNILVFVIKQETFVFKFDNLNVLQNFYRNFTTLKAVTNQKAYNKNIEAKFNLLQRTDVNGVTHIEITREPDTNNCILNENNNNGPTSIISLHVSDNLERKPRYEPNKERSKTLNRTKRYDGVKIHAENRFNTLSVSKSSSTDNILDLDKSNVDLVNKNAIKKEGTLRKVWNSAESLLDAPKRPERKKKIKPKAPLPPPLVNSEKSDIFSGQYVRVNVNFDTNKTDNSRLVIKSQCNEPHPKKLQNFSLLSTKSNLPSFLKPKPQLVKYCEPSKRVDSGTLNRLVTVSDSSWTNSVPRLLKKHRSRSETRNFTPMAYRYIDTTQRYPVTYSVQPTTPRLTSNIQGPGLAQGYNSTVYGFSQTTPNIGNRLFGLSPKLRDFNAGVETRNESNSSRWGSVSELGCKGGNLKSVIKKDENKKKNEKKVTFSAYTTVQVV